jgi:hypothetical protein
MNVGTTKLISLQDLESSMCSHENVHRKQIAKAGPMSKETFTLTHLAIIQNGAGKGMKERGKNADVQRNIPFLVPK